MVEARDSRNTLGISPVDQEAALGLFTQAELTTHVNVVLQAYISEAEKVAQVSIRGAL